MSNFKQRLGIKQLQFAINKIGVLGSVSIQPEDAGDPQNVREVFEIDFSSIDSAITAEENARIAADQGLQTAINNVQADVDQNESDADAAISALQADVDQNEADADAAISALQADVDQNEADGDTDRAAIRTEFAAADATLQSNINSEATTRAAADSALDAKIDQEIADRQTAITAALAAEMSFRGEIDASAGSPFASYGSIAKGDMFVVGTAGSNLDEDLEPGDLVIAKIAGAQLGQSPLEFAYVQRNLDDAVSKTYVDAQDAALQADIDQNESDSDAADAVLQNNIDSEAATRAAADNTLQANINTEAAARAAADTALQTELDATQGGAGLAANGQYIVPTGQNHPLLSVATSLHDATKLLEEEILRFRGFTYREQFVLTIPPATGNPSVAFKTHTNPAKAVGTSGKQLDFAVMTFGAASDEEKLAKIQVYLNGQMLGCSLTASYGTHEVHVKDNAGELELVFAEGLLDKDDILVVYVSA